MAYLSPNGDYLVCVEYSGPSGYLHKTLLCYCCGLMIVRTYNKSSTMESAVITLTGITAQQITIKNNDDDDEDEQFVDTSCITSI